FARDAYGSGFDFW
nr:immunoglobulin heavy chain junction region [Macaca mulatta]